MPYLPWVRVLAIGPLTVFRCRECGAKYLRISRFTKRLTRMSCRSHVRDQDPAFERRRHSRKKVALPVEVLMGDSTLRGSVINVSTSGLQVEVGKSIRGDVRLRFFLPGESDETVVRNLRASVVYSVRHGKEWRAGLIIGWRGRRVLSSLNKELANRAG